jgi:23S rRNA (cytidine1920-2'-O)/16S rRNA (cytidine1409-2'-O)-methyltransferase
MTRRRLDAELVRRGLAVDAAAAREAVGAGRVTIAGIPAMKVATLVADDAAVAVTGSPRSYVSRAGSKLAAALDRFDLDPAGRDCLDAGASTGGFTDCLLQRGASRVIAIDVGYGQLDWKVRANPRVVVMERTNVRGLTREALPFAPDVVVADLSFISLGVVIGTLAEIGAPRAVFVVLVKPQFEAERRDVGRGGVVRDPRVWRRVVQDVADAARSAALEPQAVMASPLRGPAGNVEFPMLLGAAGSKRTLDVEAAIREGEALLQ